MVNLSRPRLPQPKPEWSEASIWAEDSQIAMMAMAKSNGLIRPLASWQSSLATLDFGFTDVLINWFHDFNTDSAIINTTPETEGAKTYKHPITELIDIPCSKKPTIQPFEGLVYFHQHQKASTLDFTEYPDHNRLMELIRRIDKDRSALVMAFLQGLVYEPMDVRPAYTSRVVYNW
jgi:hypothetical protein